MRKMIISLAAAGTALAFATPASAQYYPQPAYGQPYGYGQNAYGQVRSLRARIDGVQRQIDQLKARRMITRSEARSLQSESRRVESRLMRAARYGLNPAEARDIGYGIARLERQVAYQARDGRGGRGYRNGYDSAYNGYGYDNGYYADNDRDGRDDGGEHDRWHAQHGDNDDD